VGLKFDKAEPGVWVSGVAHAAVLAAGLFAMTTTSFPPADEGIPVEVITDNQFSEITRGEKTAKEVTANPNPRVDRVAEKQEQRDPGEAARDVPAPPTRPAEMKVAEEEAAAPPPPPARPEPTPPEPPKREAVKTPESPKPDPKREEMARLVEQQQAEIARQQAEAKAEEAKTKAEAEAKAKAAAEAKAKAVAEAKAKAEADAKAKAVAEAKAKAEAEAKAKRQAEVAEKFNPGDIRQLLQSKQPAQSSGATGREINRTASLGTNTGTAQRLNPSQRDQLIGILQEQLHRCWVVPIALQSAPKPPVPSIRIKLNQDGSLAGEPAVMNRSAEPLFDVAADSATRAARRCAPLRIPAQFVPYYQDWKDLVVNFNLRDMG
jgi:colicin import membrane protein